MSYRPVLVLHIADAETPFHPVQGDIGQNRAEYSSYTKDNFEFRRVISFQRSPYKR